MLDELYRVAFRRNVYATIEQLQADVDVDHRLRAAAAPRPLVRRKNADANFSRQHPAC
jgi:hypothetical protein